MESISMEKELSLYNLERKWNDYIGVQKEVISVLKKNGYFDDGTIINHETGMIIRVTTKGIKETIGKGNRFQSLPKIVKQQKIATLNKLPELIKEGKLLEDNVQNYYSDQGDKFAYFISKIEIDDIMHDVRIAVKKKVGSNHFYIHHIDTKRSSELLSPSVRTEIYETQNF